MQNKEQGAKRRVPETPVHAFFMHMESSLLDLEYFAEREPHQICKVKAVLLLFYKGKSVS